TIEDNVIADIVSTLEQRSQYAQRREEIRRFNAGSRFLKRGIALTPVKFGISFTATHLNQAGALLHLYTDGTLLLNHGGTEMGQGLFTKVAQIVAEEFAVDFESVRVSAADTSKVPNASATAASSGSDLNGKAAQDAARTIKKGLTAFAVARFGVEASEVVFADNYVRVGETSFSLAEFAKLAHAGRVPLSATGYYATPKIAYDRGTFRGRPFYYFGYGAAVSEVIIDTLTGENRVLRTDIVHDVGRSLNPAIDIGQIEGGFVQGMGWLTTEELCWDAAGRLTTHAPSTYKIPVASDMPADFRVTIYENASNAEDSIFRSKAVGEPPLMLAISVFAALKDAVASLGEHRLLPKLDAPATAQAILLSTVDLRTRLGLSPDPTQPLKAVVS
ncbi:MAG TPA: molybdopterin cofactor-binding domain-containing protein, partial [Candidatus Baltobacteraceae bacterium]